MVERTYHLKNPSISRETFYAQWCAKECVVKFLNLTLDTTEKMLTKKQSQQIIITYQDKEYPVQVRDKDGYTYAIFSGSKN
ncbi:MAG: 4'-phosphopantetheinyl transferase superfamily protein [Candidatus Peribacteria bacterium]|nr:4'-phosphopantetheinyl transferase superfamily protein [Candidatus Peribacteria bacterium]